MPQPVNLACLDVLASRLREIEAPYKAACDPAGIGIGIGVSAALVEDARNEITNLREVVEGLLANWPTTEIADYYNPRTIRPVLMKNLALERAADLVNPL